MTYRLVSSCGSIASAYSESGVRDPYEVAEEEWRWVPKKKGMSFSAAFEGYLKENLALLDSPELTLPFWLKRLDPKALSKLRILTSQDDYLNRGVGENLKREFDSLSQQTAFVLPWGGHLGYVRTPEFQELLDLIYGKGVLVE